MADSWQLSGSHFMESYISEGSRGEKTPFGESYNSRHSAKFVISAGQGSTHGRKASGTQHLLEILRDVPTFEDKGCMYQFGAYRDRNRGYQVVYWVGQGTFICDKLITNMPCASPDLTIYPWVVHLNFCQPKKRHRSAWINRGLSCKQEPKKNPLLKKENKFQDLI